MAALQVEHHGLPERQEANIAFRGRGTRGALFAATLFVLVGLLLGERRQDLGLVEHLVLTVRVKLLHQLLFVPLEVIE